MARKSLAKWIDEALSDTEKDDRISAISLVHMVGQQRQELYTVKISKTGSYEGKTLESVFMGKANAYAQDLTGTQTFALLAFYGKNQEEAVQPFTVVPEGNPQTLGLMTEGPTLEGQVQQRMRQQETTFVQTYRRQAELDRFSIQIMERQERMLEMTQSRMAALMHENGEAYTIVRDLLMAQANRSHEMRMAELNYQRGTEERGKLLKFAPVLINTIVGKEVFPQSTEDSALIETIAENLEEKHIAKLAELDLPPMIMGPLAARVMKAMEKKEKEKAEANKQLPKYQGSAEEDIGGGT